MPKRPKNSPAEETIRNLLVAAKSNQTSIGSVAANLHAQHARRLRKKLTKYGLFFGNIAMVAAVVFLIFRGDNHNQTNAAPLLSVQQNNDVASPLDQLSAADIAVHVARLTALPEATAVNNQADSLNAQLAATPADERVVSKPQLANTSLKSRQDIVKYKVNDGDTVASLASKYNVTSDSIKWSNNLTSDKLIAGTELLIPPQNGIVYKVKQGDTVEALAEKYKANKELLINFNNTEVGGLPVGEYILIPDGVQPAPVVVRQVSYSSNYVPIGFTPTYSSNGYDRGYCTWYVAYRRAQAGNPIPSNLGNAITWKARAQAAGYATGTVPRAGAVAWVVHPSTSLGHVAYVESVNPDGSFVLYEMNAIGWNRVSSQTVSAEKAGSQYIFIY